MNATAETIARRLGQALLEAAVALPDGPAPVCGGLREIGALLKQRSDVRAYLEHPRVSHESKDAVISALASGDTGASDLVRRLLRILAARQALRLLPAVEARLVAEWNERRGVIVAEAQSAAPLAASTAEALRQALEKASQHSVELTTSVDPALMGGVIVRFSGRTLDGSVRGRLRTLRERLRQSAAR